MKRYLTWFWQIAKAFLKTQQQVLTKEVCMLRRDWLLVALGSPEAPLTPVQLQKSLFLLAKNRSTDVGTGFYKFAPYHYGPFCIDIYLDAENLEASGLVAISSNPQTQMKEYSLTDKGRLAAQTSENSLPKTGTQYLRKVITWASGLTFSQLVGKIYELYPEFRKQSVFQR